MVSGLVASCSTLSFAGFVVVIEKLAELARRQGELLREHSLGHPQWYAENLVCVALRGRVMPTNFKAYDIESDEFGRVQVKSRVDGTDTSYDHNRTNFGKYALGAFDWGAVVIFTPGFRIDGAKLLQQKDLAPLVMAAGHVKWAAVQNHPNALDIKCQLVEIAGET